MGAKRPKSGSEDERSESSGVRLTFDQSLFRRPDLLVAVLIVVAVLGAATLPAVTTARPANEVPVGTVDAAAGNATADAWTRVPSATMALSSAPSGLPAASNVSVRAANLQAATNETHMLLRVSWADATADRDIGGPREFADAVAVQVPEDPDSRPPIAMGGSSNRVNVWFWDGTGTTEELLAGGAGTTTDFRNTSVAADAAHRNGRWHVTFARELAGQANRTDLAVNRDVDVALAVWNGSYHERSGRKAVSEWHYLAMGPGPEGPPYETILWVVAGLAVLFVAAVTIEGVRRTRGGDGS
mgnify:CR=1 FL=1